MAQGRGKVPTGQRVGTVAAAQASAMKHKMITQVTAEADGNRTHPPALAGAPVLKVGAYPGDAANL